MIYTEETENVQAAGVEAEVAAGVAGIKHGSGDKERYDLALLNNWKKETKRWFNKRLELRNDSERDREEGLEQRNKEKME